MNKIQEYIEYYINYNYFLKKISFINYTFMLQCFLMETFNFKQKIYKKYNKYVKITFKMIMN